MKLPDPDDKLVLGDGCTIEPVEADNKLIEIPTKSEAQQIVTSTRRKLADLPGLPSQLNTVAAVLVYTASGILDDEIAVATGLARDQIRRVRLTPIYRALEDHVKEAVLESSQQTVIGVLASKEVDAARTLTELLASESDKVALGASKTILELRGHSSRPTDMGGLFRIEIVDRRKDVIDIGAAEDGNRS